LKSQLDDFEEDDFDEEDREKYDYIKNSILELDIELERNIRKFDVEIYKKRLEVFEQNKKQGKEEVKEQAEIVVESTPISTVVEVKEPVVEETPVASIVSTEPDSKKVDSIRGKLASLKKELNVNPAKFDEDRISRNEQEQEQIQEVEAEDYEVEEFEKKANVKPKKGSLSIILMTIGFGILTFGSVMYFKERK